MALNFPDSPTLNQVYTDTTSGFSYQWDGVVWKSYTASASKNISIVDNIESSFNGSTQTFALAVSGVSLTPANAQQLRVVLGGIVQEPITNYTVSGPNITFIIAPIAGLDCSIVSLGPAVPVNVPGDGTVTPAKLSTGGPSWNTSGGVTITGTGTTALLVNGNARVTGILTVGASSITLDGANNTINVGSLSISQSGISGGTPDVTARNISGVAATFTGNVSIGGTLTYEDVTNVDSIGIITARAGVNVTGGSLVISSGGLTVSGVTTVSAGSTSAPSISPSGDSNTGIFFPSADTVAIAEGGAEAARFDSSRRLLVGTASAYTDVIGGAGGYTGSLWIATADSTGTGPFISAWTSSSSLDQMGTSIVLSRSKGNVVGIHTALASGNAIGSISFNGSDGSKFVSGAVIRAEIDGGVSTNDLPGRLVFSTTADGAASPTERMRITNSGVLRIGQSTSDVPGITGDTVVGTALGANGYIAVNRDGNAGLYVGRKTNDGDLVYFNQDGNLEGTISVSGTTVSYNGAHLSRWSQLSSGAEREEILRGTVLSNLDEMCEWGEEDNEQLNRMKVSDVEGDKNVAGVFQAWDDDDDTYTNDFYCAMTGDFIIRIGSGVTVERGDLLMSAGDGTAKPQDDDIVRSKTVAKVTSTSVTCTYDDGSYCVPCVLMAC